jgi:FdhE protein
MRQGEVTSKGAWVGNPLGGVQAPDAIILPDPSTRFANTAARLETLSAGHPMAEWLRFMAHIAASQHVAARTLGTLAGPMQMTVEQAVDARMPPLAADGHRRDPAWRDGLTLLLNDFAMSAVPEPAREVMASLRNRRIDAVEALADNFVHGSVDAADAGAALYVVAALQVYFTGLVAALPAPALRLLPQRGLCPCCGSTSVSSVVTESGKTPRARYLYCSLCATGWNHVRAACITCGQSRSVVLKEIAGDSGTAKAETCDDCRSYTKVLYQAQDTKLDPFADDLATLALDVLVGGAGWSRHAPNPLLLIG